MTTSMAHRLSVGYWGKGRQRKIAPGLHTIHCRLCGERTVARSTGAATLIGWHEVSLITDSGFCPAHPLQQAQRVLSSVDKRIRKRGG